MNISRKELTRIKKQAIKTAFENLCMFLMVEGFIAFVFIQVLIKLCK